VVKLSEKCGRREKPDWKGRGSDIGGDGGAGRVDLGGAPVLADGEAGGKNYVCGGVGFTPSPSPHAFRRAWRPGPAEMRGPSDEEGEAEGERVAAVDARSVLGVVAAPPPKPLLAA
jgi:hypothetical protein